MLSYKMLQISEIILYFLFWELSHSIIRNNILPIFDHNYEKRNDRKRKQRVKIDFIYIFVKRKYLIWWYFLPFSKTHRIKIVSHQTISHLLHETKSLNNVGIYVFFFFIIFAWVIKRWRWEAKKICLQNSLMKFQAKR